MIDSKKNLELTIRTASIIKGLSGLVNCSSMTMAHLILRDLGPQIQDLVKFVTDTTKNSEST